MIDDEVHQRIDALEEQVARLLERTESVAWRDAADDDAARAKWVEVLSVMDEGDEAAVELGLPWSLDHHIAVIKEVVAKAVELGLVPRRELVVTDAMVDLCYKAFLPMEIALKGHILRYAAHHWSGEGETE
jgi:hypothetical protein